MPEFAALQTGLCNFAVDRLGMVCLEMDDGGEALGPQAAVSAVTLWKG